MTENSKPYAYAPAPKMILKEVSLGAHEAMGAVTIAIEGEGISIECTVVVSREDAMSINRAVHTWHRAFEAMNSSDDVTAEVTMNG